MPSFRYYIHQLNTLPFREIIKRAMTIAEQFYRSRAGKVRAKVLGTTMSDRVFLERAFSGAFPDERALLAYFRSPTRSSFFTNRTGVVAALSGLDPSVKESIISQADRICDHIFDLLGSGDIPLGPKIDWHCDFKTGYCWSPRTYYRDIPIPYGKADIKVPWELSRFQHLTVLGQAYWLTNDEKYAKEFVNQVSDWIDANLPKFGANWNCTMDVAIRACNWITAYSFFKESPGLSDVFLLKFLKSLYQHGKHIRENLEYSETLTSNHYLSNIVGLVYLGILFPEFKEAVEWREFGVKELKNEMMKQVYPDGCDFEASTCYHRLVLELFFYPTLAVVTNDKDFTGANHQDVTDKLFGREYRERLFRMFEAVLFLLKPDGAMPQIGDNDSGRLHVFAARNILDMRYLLCLGSIFFKEPEFKIREFGYCEEALWVFGSEGLAAWQALEERTLAAIGSRAFADAGWFVMRNDRDYMVISCGPNGQNNNGGHAHNDKLSFELCFDGRDIIVDPGTYLYTPDPEARNAFRSTSYHNTVMVNGLEQNSFNSGLLFSLGNESRAKTTSWHMASDKDEFKGGHAGFDQSGFHHVRSVRYDKAGHRVVILDEIIGEHPQSTASFHLRPGANAVLKEPGHCRIDGVTFAFTGYRRIEVVDSWYSVEYGRREKSRCLKVHFGDRLETRISEAAA